MNPLQEKRAGLPAAAAQLAHIAPTLARVPAAPAANATIDATADTADTAVETAARTGTTAPATGAPAPAAAVAAELVTVHAPRGPVAEAFRTLRSRLASCATATWDAGPALAVVGTGRGGGRSWCAANLAVSMAQRGGPVLLLDANLRRPRLHRLFGLPHRGGLAALLAGPAALDAVQPVPQVPGLFLLAAGETPTHPLELLEPPAFARLLQALGERFVHVVVDTPAAAEGADAAVIAARCDAALLVTRRDHDTLADLQALRATLAQAGTAVAGVLLNGH